MLTFSAACLAISENGTGFAGSVADAASDAKAFRYWRPPDRPKFLRASMRKNGFAESGALFLTTASLKARLRANWRSSGDAFGSTLRLTCEKSTEAPWIARFLLSSSAARAIIPWSVGEKPERASPNCCRELPRSCWPGAGVTFRFTGEADG